ncbi:MAG: isoaspartyl peptidase/L-asparaginase [Deltaproteobacteria bacterium]|nr:isoaspartyl peptidase/L-asparaginase [Deltaproteobacteria bacterium]
MTAIVVHGGAGLVAAERHARLRDGVRAAAAAGDAILSRGGSSLDAVVAAVRVLEDDPEFNAGCGSALTRDGTVETDASVMDGATQRVGAVGAVPDLGCAIALARAVLDRGEHVLLAGSSAWDFAREVGIAPAPAGALITERARMRLADVQKGTVGAVARDRDGRFAAATSTGGIAGKRRGRVGDSPIPGAGTWADAHCAISATGDGEAILRVALAHSIAMRIASGTPIDRAVRESLSELQRVTNGSAGVIAVDRSAFSALQLSSTMPVAAISDGVHADSMGTQI